MGGAWGEHTDAGQKVCEWAGRSCPQPSSNAGIVAYWVLCKLSVLLVVGESG